MSNNVVVIENQEVAIKAYDGKRVVTFKDIDRVHKRTPGTAGRVFRANKKHFIEDEDYYKITPDTFRRTIGEMDKRQQNDVILITEFGYFMIAKSLTDDKAWEVQRKLVNEYFRKKEDPSRGIVKLHNGVPVVTLSDIDEFHGLEPGTARNFFGSVRDQFNLDEDYYLGDPEQINKVCGTCFPLGRPVALLKQHAYELSMFTHIPLPNIKGMVPKYFTLPDPEVVNIQPAALALQPSAIVDQPVAAIEQKPVENLTAELIIPNRGVRDKIDLTFSAYAATYNYYRSGKRIKTKNLHKVDGYGYLEGIGSNILSHAAHYGCAGYGPLTMRPDEDPHFCFPLQSMRKDGKITIPKLGLFESKTPLWIEEGSRPVTATVRRTKDNKYMVEIRRKSN